MTELPLPTYSTGSRPNLRPQFLKDWSKHAACIGRWELFDGVTLKAKAICTNECSVRKECLKDSLAFEKEMEDRERGADGEFAGGTGRRYWRHGTRGGYKPTEREAIALALAGGASIEDF